MAVIKSVNKKALSSAFINVIEFFEKNTSEKWELYSKPFLNGLQPDIILLNPAVGIALYSILDITNDKFPILEDTKFHNIENKHRKIIEGHISKLNLTKEEIIRLYCPRLGGKKNGMAVIDAGIIFPNVNNLDHIK